MNRLLQEKDNRIGKMIGAGKNDAQIIETLYWSTLTRAPSKAEFEAMQQHVDSASDRRKALEDVAWSLLNAKEFLLRK